VTKEDGVWHENYYINCSMFKLAEKCPNLEPALHMRGNSWLSGARPAWQTTGARR